MAFENLADWASKLSIQEILKGNFSAFEAVFYLAVAIAVYAIVIWHFYRFIARRDCFKLSSRVHKRTIGFLKYFFVFPFVAFAFFIGFSLLMLFLTKGYEIEVVLSTSFAIVLAIRITAYYNEDLSKDVSKMLPFALLGIFLVDPSYFSFGDVGAKIDLLPDFFSYAIQYILFIILVEWILRTLLTIRYAIFPKKQQIPPEES